MKNYALISATALLTIAFLLIWDSPPESFLKNSEGRPERVPLADSYMRQVKTRVYSKDGKLIASAENTIAKTKVKTEVATDKSKDKKKEKTVTKKTFKK